MGIDLARTGIDAEALKLRFTPTQTIETSKETLEWLQKRMPPGIGSSRRGGDFETQLTMLEASARSAVDIPAKIKRSPGEGGGGRRRCRLPRAQGPAAALRGGQASGPRPVEAAAQVDAARRDREDPPRPRRRRRPGARRARTRLRRLRPEVGQGQRQPAAGRAPLDGDPVRGASRQDGRRGALLAPTRPPSPSGWPRIATEPSRRPSRRATPPTGRRSLPRRPRRPRTSRGAPAPRAVHSGRASGGMADAPALGAGAA